MGELLSEVQALYEAARPDELGQRGLNKTSPDFFTHGIGGLVERHRQLGHRHPLAGAASDILSGALLVAGHRLGGDKHNISLRRPRGTFNIGSYCLNVGLALAITGCATSTDSTVPVSTPEPCSDEYQAYERAEAEMAKARSQREFFGGDPGEVEGWSDDEWAAYTACTDRQS